ncbi:MAG: nucleotidyl transferase AbiEii/AbiGii toxin family protein [bacterium]
MIDLLHQYIEKEKSYEGKVNKLREFLQLLILKIIQDKGYFSHISFTGGTALRILYDLRRFSEDLDFSVIDKKKYVFKEVILSIIKELELYGISVEKKMKELKTVNNSMLKFQHLLGTLGLSMQSNQKLSIKIDIDTNPPAGWKLENTLVNKQYLVNIRHFDLSSLFATKIHACTFRTYVKGRDYYDLLWYLGKKIKPNYIVLNNAIKQTQGIKYELNDATIGNFLIKKIESINFKTLQNDVERFLEDKNDLMLLQPNVFIKAIKDFTLLFCSRKNS